MLYIQYFESISHIVKHYKVWKSSMCPHTRASLVSEVSSSDSGRGQSGVYVCGLCGSPLHQGQFTDIYGTDSYVLPHDTTRVQISGGWVRVLHPIQMSSSDLHQRCVFPSASLSWSVQTAALTCRYNILHLMKTLDRNALMDGFFFVLFCL